MLPTSSRPALYESWGRALGRQLPPMAKFVVGGDVRASTPPFLAALMEGLCQAGLDVVDLGLLPTPMIYYAKHRLQADGCAIVTASHNPADDQRPEMDARRPAADARRRGRLGAERAKRLSGDGRRPHPRHAADARHLLRLRGLPARDVRRLAGGPAARGARPHARLLGGKARRYLHAIFPQCLFSTIHDAVDAQFGGRAPDCSRPHELDELCEAVYRERAHLGMAFDGDGDRIALVDNEGVALGAEETAWVLLQCLGDELRGQRFVYDLKFSDRIAEAARQLGAEPLVGAQRPCLPPRRMSRDRRGVRRRS